MLQEIAVDGDGGASDGEGFRLQPGWVGVGWLLAGPTLLEEQNIGDDIGAFAVYLCSDDGAFITGQSISVDGGLQEHMPYYADFTTGAAKWG